jgi:L,D-peptidoglycan transpeptidase YkuD (ErfK/YbiS/YcfS/YnhG family)
MPALSALTTSPMVAVTRVRFVRGWTTSLLALVATATLVAPSGPRAGATTGSPIRPEQLRSGLVGSARQLVMVSATSSDTTTATVTLWTKQDSTWLRTAGPFTATIAGHGMSAHHREGDGTTPQGSYALVSAFGLLARGRIKLAYTQVHPGSCWISDARRTDYNTMVTARRCDAPNENLYGIAQHGAYLRSIVTSYNMDPIVAGRGSAIFVHLVTRTRSGRSLPTAGCISLPGAALNVIWRWVDAAASPRIVIGPTAWLTTTP